VIVLISSPFSFFCRFFFPFLLQKQQTTGAFSKPFPKAGAEPAAPSPFTPNATGRVLDDTNTAKLDSVRSVSDMFAARVKQTPDTVAFWEKPTGTGSNFEKTTWQDFHAKASAVAGFLAHKAGLKSGETVAISGPTKGPWLLSDMGAQLAGQISVGIYPGQSKESLQYLIEHSETRVMSVFAQTDLENICELKAGGGIPLLSACILWDESQASGLTVPKGLEFISFAEVLESEPLSEEERISRNRTDDETAVLIYTSGTTGPPKAAMLAQRQVLASCESSMLPGAHTTDYDFILSFLPLAHGNQEKQSPFYFGCFCCIADLLRFPPSYHFCSR
jgi:long-chain acyl-CoA synthetase